MLPLCVNANAHHSAQQCAQLWGNKYGWEDAPYGMHQPRPQGIITTCNQSTRHQFCSSTLAVQVDYYFL